MITQVEICEHCMWAIWDYAGMEAVACMACDDKCPTEQDVEASKYGGYMAYYGCAKDHEDNEEEE